MLQDGSAKLMSTSASLKKSAAFVALANTVALANGLCDVKLV